MADPSARATSRSSSPASWLAAVPAPVRPVGIVLAGAVIGQVVSFLGGTSTVPPEIVVRGLVNGLANSLLVVGLVLIYRAARIINFSHASVGYAATVGYLLLRVVYGWGFWLTVGAVVAGSALLGLIMEVAVIRRFAKAPRLVVTVVTIALGSYIVGIALSFVPFAGFEAGDQLPPTAPSMPFSDRTLSWGVDVFGFAEFAAVGISVSLLVALSVFLRGSTTGVAIRGAAENRSRAALLGVNVNSLSAVVWIIAAVLATIGALLSAFMQEASLAATAGAAGTAAFSARIFVQALAAAVIGRMENIPVAIGASLAIALVNQSLFWTYRETALVDGVLVIVIVGSLLLQRRAYGRADDGASGTWEAAEELQSIPSVLAVLEPVRRATSRFGLAVGVALLAFPWVMSPSQTLEGSLFAIYAIVAVSLVVLTGWGGQISLGQFGIVAVGALIGGWATAGAGLPFPIAVVLAMVAGAVAAVVVGLPALRIQGLFLAATSLGFAVAAQSILLNDRWFGGLIQRQVTRPVFFGIDMNTSSGERAFFYLCVAAAGLSLLVAVSLRRTRTGRILIALRDNDRAAQSYGINLLRTRLTTFAIAGALAGLAGVLFANHQYGVAQANFSPDESIFVFLMAVMGGLGSVYGVLTGVIYFGMVQILLPSAGLQLVASSTGVLIVLLFFPGGLGGLAYRARDAWLRRIATRYRIFVPSLLGVDRRLDDESELIPIAGRVDDRETVERIYTLESAIAGTGASQQREAVR